MSESPSPAFCPCGIPDELEPLELELELVEVAAGADELEDVEDEDPPPQPATTMAPTASASASHRRGEIHVLVIDPPPNARSLILTPLAQIPFPVTGGGISAGSAR